MKKEVMEQWVKALRSGDYKQCEGALQDASGNYCCLGVLCDISKLTEWQDGSGYGPMYFDLDSSLPKQVRDWSGVRSSGGDLSESDLRRVDSLIDANDTEKMSFTEIADIIEEHWESL